MCIYVCMLACVCTSACAGAAAGRAWGLGGALDGIPNYPTAPVRWGQVRVGSESWLCPCPAAIPSTGLRVAGVPLVAPGHWPCPHWLGMLRTPAALTALGSGAPAGNGLPMLRHENEALRVPRVDVGTAPRRWAGAHPPALSADSVDSSHMNRAPITVPPSASVSSSVE